MADTNTDSDGTPDCNDNCQSIFNPDQADCDGNGAADLCEACIGDLDGDGLVYGGDLGLLLFEWGPGPSPADLNGDGIVDGGDVGILLIEWGPCGD